MSRRIRRKTFSKERIVMVVSSVLVLSALTATGLWMGSDEDTDDGGYVVDLTSIENKEAEQNVAGQQVQVVGDTIRNTVPSDDLDYDPYFQETNSVKVENPDVSQSESMSAKEEMLLPEDTETVTEEADLKEEEDAPALSTAMLPSLNYEEGDALVWPVVGNVLINYSMDKTIYFSIPKDVTHGRGYIYSLQYHIVWVTKYRKPIFIGDIEIEVKNYLLETLKSLDMTLLAMELMPDHIHLLVDCKPQLRLSDAIKILKGNTARWLFLKHPEIKPQLWDGHLWNPSYFVATVSDRTLEQVQTYIENQKTN